MGWNDHMDDELTDLLKELVYAGFVFEGGAPFDVAQKVIRDGKASLTPAEADVFEDQLLPALRALEETKLEHDADDALGEPARPGDPPTRPA
jgi:hypothetical protein